ncbi:formimidoylglutamase [Longimicrobium sp.]|uniref:formimidoylglutamase n=1 Tax=Longimicrobium sp. TaxID=2029185 RepID=UPI002E35AF3C|nr:formimidoylglutamase [Longimicrobium sp.]HEX6040498.1 formimidoylglutamase [Longimicrobium sp.]
MTDPLAGLRAGPDPRDPRAPALLQPYREGEPLDGRTVVLGFPYDGGIPSRPGARFGPRAIREALASFGSHDGEKDVTPVLDLGDVALPQMNGADAHAKVQEAARQVFASGALPVFLGGDHGITGSIVRGLADARPHIGLALMNIDAHLDVREYEDEAHLSSGTPFRRAMETPILDGAHVTMIGIRRFANSRYYLDFAAAQGIRLSTVEEVQSHGAATVAKAALYRATTGADALYLSIDMDAADAAFAPGVSAPGTGGLTAREMIDIVRTVAVDPRLVGADIMETSPPYDPDGRTARLAARLLLEILAARP